MKDVLKNWITSLLGVVIVLASIGLIYFGKIGVWESLPLFCLGWVFIFAKDKLLEEITFKFLKIKDEE